MYQVSRGAEGKEVGCVSSWQIRVTRRLYCCCIHPIASQREKLEVSGLYQRSVNWNDFQGKLKQSYQVRMADVREDTAMKDLQIVCSWVPTASPKPNQLPICKNCQDKEHPVQANWQEQEINQTNLSELGVLPGDFLPGPQCQTAPACCSSTDFANVSGGSNNWQAIEVDSSNIGPDSLNNLSFGNLLALVHTQGQRAVGNGPEHTDSVATTSCFHPLNEGSQLTVSFDNSPLRDQENVLEANYDAESNVPNVFTDAASGKIKSSQFEPVTPLENKKDEYSMHRRQYLSIEDVRAGKAREENKTTGNGVMELHETKEKSQQVINQSSVTFRQLHENHKVGNGGQDQVGLIATPQQKPRRKKHGPRVIIEGKQKGTPKSSAEKLNPQQKTTGIKRKYVRRKGIYEPEDNVDLIETPQQKPRRKKHRPRVIIEGKQKGTPKSSAEKLNLQQKTTRVKRKYVRRKGIYEPEGHADNRITKTSDEGPCTQRTRSSCRRFLNFNLDDQEKEQSLLYCPSSNCNRISQAENLNAKDPSKRTVHCGLEIVVMVDKTDTGIPHDQENMLAENFDAGSNMPEGFTDGSSIPSKPYFDLNLPPPTITNAALDKTKSSQFEPATPEKNTKDENRMLPSLSTEEVRAGKDREENKITGNVVMDLNEMKEKSQQVIDQLSVVSRQLQENHKPDNGGEDQVDSIKTPQLKSRRKKHRPKVIIEGKQKGTPKPSVEKFNLQQKTTGVKRKYVRRKGIYTPEDNVDNRTTKTADEGSCTRHTRSSCRRFLKFNLEDQEKYEKSAYCTSSNCNTGSQADNLNAKSPSRIVQCGEEIVVIMDKPDPGISHECMHSMNQVQEVFMERSGQSHLSSRNMHLLKNHTLTDQLESTRGKCQIVFSDVTHDKEINTFSMSMNRNEQRTEKSLSDSIGSSTCLTPERQNLSRQNMTILAEAEIGNRIETGKFDNSLQNYLPLFSEIANNNSTSGLYFPAICKKRRSRKRRNMVTSTWQCTSSTDNHAKVGQCNIRYSSTMFSMLTAHASNQNESQVLEDMLALRPKERMKKRRSKGRKRLRDLSSLLEFHKKLPASPGGAATKSRNGQGHRILHEPQTFMEDLAVDTRTTTIRKKRSTRNVRINPTVPYNQQKSSAILMGLPLALTWKCRPSVDSISKQLNQLDLNAESIHGLPQHQNALVKYHTRYHKQNALVPFHRYGAIVPFHSSFDHDRRGLPRPKVDIDDETTRVWKLLLENINSEGIDGINEENTKWWEEERIVFSGRAESFIARMRLVQGDRRFSPWKGSVVDSVVGVFLTQNVSDHLSSSAFISLAAQFPINSQTHPADLHEEKLGIKIKEPETCDIDPEGTSKLNKEILNQPVYGEDTIMLQDYDIIREVGSARYLGNSSSGFVSKDNLTHQSIESSKYNLVKSCDTVANKSASVFENGRDREDVCSSEKSADSPTANTTEKSDSCAQSSTTEEPTAVESNRFTSSTSFVKLLQMAGTILERGPSKKVSDLDWQGQSESLATNLCTGDHLNNATFPTEPVPASSESIMHHARNLGGQATKCDLSHEASKFFKRSSKKELCAAEISGLSSESAQLETRLEKITTNSFLEGSKFSSSNNHDDQVEINQTGQVPAYGLLEENHSEIQVLKVATYPQHTTDVRGSSGKIDNSRNSEHKDVNSNKSDPDYHHGQIINGEKVKRGRTRKKKEKRVKWDNLRKQALAGARERARTANTMDSVDWDAVRCTDVNEIAKTIKERGMNNMLAQRIKDFLNRLVKDHGSMDLEWLRDIPPDKAKEYLLSIRGLGLKSVECVRLLTLHHVAFPVDTNVGRIAVRLGWVPLQPLPESLQLHLLELYPVLESIQKYLWPRLCKLDQGTLYELHYQMITFGKVFCTKSKPNCNACPMRGECRHFASAFASARLALPAPEEKGIVCTNEKRTANQNPMASMNNLRLPLLQANQMDAKGGAIQPIIEEPPSPEPIIEVPTTPESPYTEVSEPANESAFSEEPDEIPTIQLNMEEFTHNLQEIMQQNKGLVDSDMSKALVALTSEAASIPVPKLKNVSRLRTEHQVYELPDSHPLLEGMDKREPDDPSPYLLAIWTPGETVDSIQPPEGWCRSQSLEKLCTSETCSSCHSIREANSQTVRGTVLVPCRTAMRGSFPLNGTYFQVNEVFSDHESSLSPFNVPRAWLWNLPKRTVFFGTSIPTIFKGLSTEGIQYCFWRGFVCVRGFDRKTRAPRPLVARLHFPASKLTRRKGKMDNEYI